MTLFFDPQRNAEPSLLQQRALKEAVSHLYALAGADKEDYFVFTSSGAEGVNHAVLSTYIDVTRKTGKNHFLCGVLDEAPAIMALERLNELGCVSQMVPASREGQITPQAVAEMFTPRTALLSLSAAHGLTGVVQSLEEIGALCKERGVLFHVDATHILGKGDFSFEQSGADFVTFQGPKGGMGALFIRSGIEISPLIVGGREQGGLRGGPFDAAALVCFGQWAKEELALKDHYCMEIARLRDLFEEKILNEIPGAEVLFAQENRLPALTSLLFPGVVGETLQFFLRGQRVHASCGGGSLQHFSHILKACGLSAPKRYCAISFSFPSTIEEQEIVEGAKRVIEGVGHLQKYSRELMEESV